MAIRLGLESCDVLPELILKAHLADNVRSVLRRSEIRCLQAPFERVWQAVDGVPLDFVGLWALSPRFAEQRAAPSNQRQESKNHKRHAARK